MRVEQEITRHYTRGGLERAILDALMASGKDIERVTVSDLSSVDEFHLGWQVAASSLAEHLGLERAMHVLDVGSGIGGPARHFAEGHGCRVTGIDLTAEFVAVASALTRRCGLDDGVLFLQANALALPFAAATFDAASLIHVGMNVEDKATLFREVRRVLKPGSRFGVYDIVSAADSNVPSPMPWPMPWAATAETSFLEPAEFYRRLLAAAGFELENEYDHRELAMRLGREMRKNIAKHGLPPLGLHILMGRAAPQRLGNMMSALENKIIAPVEFIVRAA